MSVALSPSPVFQGLGFGGLPLPGGKLFTYIAGTSTPQATYVDSTQTTPNSNPVILNANGQANVWLVVGQTYKLILQDVIGNQIWAVDQIPGGFFLTPAAIGNILYPIIPAEASVTVTDTIYPYLDPRRYGGVGDGVTNDTVAVQAAFTVASQNGGTVKIQLGLDFLCTANINVQVAINGFGNAPFSPDLEGSGWTNWGITFSGAAVTTGLTYTGSLPSNPSYAGSIRNIAIRGVSSASQGITYSGCTKPLIWQSFIYGFAGRGVYYTTCIMPVLEKTLLANCGNSSFGIVEVDNSTTFRWDHSYISGGASGCLGGLIIDETQTVMILGGAIESCNTPIKISSKISSSIGCTGVTIQAIDLENPGNGNRYIDVGATLTGGGLVSSIVLDGWTGSPDTPTTTMPSGVRFQNTIQAECRTSNFTVAGTPTASYELGGTNNLGVHILPHRNLYGNSYPWVTINGTQIKAASPQYDWVQSNSPIGLSGLISGSSISGTAPSILFNSSQGGFYKDNEIFNGSPTTMTLTGGEAGMEITLFAGDSQTTFNPGTGANQFKLLAGTLTTTTGLSYSFISNGTYWSQH